MATIYYTDTTTEVRDGLTFAQCQAIVGGPIEVVYCQDRCVMLVNQEGPVKRLSRNIKATERVQDTDITSHRKEVAYREFVLGPGILLADQAEIDAILDEPA